MSAIERLGGQRSVGGALHSVIVDRSPYVDAFGPFQGRIWLNAAHQGPLPRVAGEALADAAALKRRPHLIADSDFLDVPRRLREALGRLLSVPAAEIVVGNSATYGLQLFVSGLDWRAGDDVLVVAGDFPASITPWFALAQRFGVNVRVLEPRGPMLTGDEVIRVAGSRSRLLCASWINSFTGAVLDVESIGSACRELGVLFVLNATQGIGARSIEPASLPVDALTSSGFKWLCGPYGTGFAWIRSEVIDRLEPAHYWLALPDDGHLEDALTDFSRPRGNLAHRAFDVFGTASFLNVIPWTAAISYLDEIGTEAIAAHDDHLVQRLLDRLDPERFRIISPASRKARSTIAVFSHREPRRNSIIHASLTQAGIDTSLRAGSIRVSAHLYNSAEEIEELVEIAIAAGDGC
jgi:cysteine desulfurase/selenocysteine lyase